MAQYGNYLTPPKISAQGGISSETTVRLDSTHGETSNLFEISLSNISNSGGDISKTTKLDNTTKHLEIIQKGALTDKVSLRQLKYFYNLKGWSLVYPFLSSLFIMIYERDINFRSISHFVIACTCIWAFINTKCFEPRKNWILTGIISTTLLLSALDFMVQFGIIGNRGWNITQAYQYCFDGLKPKDPENENLLKKICVGFKILYYLQAINYFICLSCFTAFIYSVLKILKMTSYIKSDETFMVKLEEEIDEDDQSGN